MNKILFNGYYGFQNTGDDAFIEVAAWGAKKYWSSLNNTFLTENLPIIQNNAKHLSKSRFKGQNIVKTTSLIILSDSFICAGGSTFHSRISNYNPKNIARLKKKINPKFNLGAIGVSLGPYKSVIAEKENIELLKYFDFLSLRDKASYDIALSYNLPYSPIEAFDLAAILPEVYEELPLYINKTNKIILGISLCNYESYLHNGDIKNEERRNKRIESLLTEIAQHNKEIIFRFFVFNGNPVFGDKPLALTFANKMKSMNPHNVEIVDYDLTTYNTWRKIKECNLVFATRLHAAIFSCFVGVPFFLVEYHRKCSDFLESIGYCDKYRMFDSDFQINTFVNYISDILNNKIDFIKPKKINEAISKSKLNFSGIIFHQQK